jgi:cytochrome c peroxidase
MARWFDRNRALAGAVLRRLTPALLAATLAATVACKRSDAVVFDAAERGRIARMSPLGAPPADPTNPLAGNPEAVALGHRLFFEPRLSGSGFACAHCHRPDAGFGDVNLLSRAAGETTRHAPAILHMAWNRWFYWDGRADTLATQALQPIEHPAEMAGDRTAAARLLLTDAALRAASAPLLGPLPDSEWAMALPPRASPLGDDAARQAWEALPEADRQTVNRLFLGIGRLLAAYERELVTDDSPFDRFAGALAAGDTAAQRTAMPAAATRGLKLFAGKAGCWRCHHGPTLSDGEFHNLGLGVRPWLPPRDPGRAAGIERLRSDPFVGPGPLAALPSTHPAWAKLHRLATHDEQAGQFKTPHLRDVAHRARFMHGGHLRDLEAVVRFYNDLPEVPEGPGHREEMLAPLGLSGAEQKDLVAFLQALTGRPRRPDLHGPPAP